MTARLKTWIWVDAFLRQAEARGHFGTVLHKGDADAGQVFVMFSRADRRLDVLRPPPGPAYDEDGERRFERAFPDAQAWPDVREWIAKMRARDGDLWVIEIEAREGFAGLTIETPQTQRKG